METEVLCNSDRNIGYVPVFRTFSSSISSLYLNKVELTVLGNETFRELSTIRVRNWLRSRVAIDVILYDNPDILMRGMINTWTYDVCHKCATR